MARIKLTRGKFAIVDKKDLDTLVKYSWNANKTGYAVANVNGENVYMHRFLNQTPKGFHTDHINRNKLDNRRKNLRTATSSENAFNSKIPTNNTSGYKGLYWYERYKKWEVFITIHGKRIYLKRYSKLEDALEARKQAELAYKIA